MGRVIVLLLLLSLLGGSFYYLTRRLHQGFACFCPKLRFWQVAIGVGGVFLLLVLGFIRGWMPLPSGLMHILGWIGAFSMAFCLYLLLFTMAADLLLLVPRWLKLTFTAHRLYRGWVIISVLLLTVATCVGGFINARHIRHVSYDIPLQGKQDVSDLNVVMISDLHLGAVGSEDRLDDIVAKINALHPDVICIAGDIFDTDFSSIQDPQTAANTLRQLNATHGVYACLGNHDGGQTHPQMRAFLKQANVRLLDDAYTVIDQRLVLVGRLDGASIGGYGDAKRQELSAFFVREDPTLPVVVLDHNPSNIDQYTTDADLILCGHTHKGQVFPGNLITNLLYTVDYGYYQKDAASPHVVVTSGVGAWGMPVRVGTHPEIVSIRFVQE